MSHWSGRFLETESLRAVTDVDSTEGEKDLIDTSYSLHVRTCRLNNTIHPFLILLH